LFYNLLVIYIRIQILVQINILRKIETYKCKKAESSHCHAQVTQEGTIIT